MLASAMNFVIGFFGYPFDGMYEQSVTIEAPGVRFSVAAYNAASSLLAV